MSELLDTMSEQERRLLLAMTPAEISEVIKRCRDKGNAWLERATLIEAWSTGANYDGRLQ
jgi:hypothetical protein